MTQALPSPSMLAERVLAAAWDGELPINPAALADKIMAVHKHGDGVSHYPITIQPRNGRVMEGASGFARFVDGESPHFLCTYNVDESPVRHRFAQAYELAHVLMRHVLDQDGSYRCDVFFRDTGDPESSECLAFVTSLLMPVRQVRAMAQKHADIDHLAKAFGVSLAAMRKRLQSLGLL